MRSRLVESLARSDRVLLVVLAIVLAMTSTTVGASMMPRVASELVRIVRIEKSVVKLVNVPPGPETVPVNAASRDGVLSGLLAEHRCLAEVMYYEARGEGEEGEKAVAEVVFHRLASGEHGHSICGVVYEGVDRVVCQFSFACDGSRDREKSQDDWHKAELLAARILTGQVMLSDETDGAVNYHAVYVQPRWAREFMRTAQIGNHIFYRTRGPMLIGASMALRGSSW